MKKTALSAMLISFITTLLFISTAAAAAPFKDVPSNHWAYSDIQILAGKGILNGYSDGSFKPGQNVTREQAAKIISLAADIEPVYPKTATYPDVPTSHWAFGYIEGLSAAGVIDGKANGSFAPKEPLTRAQMAKILTESFNLEANSDKHFRDVPETAWMFEYVMALRDSGITLGYPEDNSFRPYGNVTRAQMAAFANRAMTWELESEVEPILEEMKQEIMEELHKLVSEARLAAGHYELNGLFGTSGYAHAKAKEMFFHGEPDDFYPEQQLTTENMNRYGYPVRMGGESIATGTIGSHTLEDVVDGWINPPVGHSSYLFGSWDDVEYGIYGDMKTGRIVYTAAFMVYKNEGE